MFAMLAVAQSNEPLRFQKTIPLPDVQGRIDHMSLDISSGRLFMAALGNNTVEVIDVKQGKRIHSIPGLHEPQGVLYLHDLNRLYVANADDGTVCIFDGKSYDLVKTVRLGEDADNVRFNAEKKQVYVGYGSGAMAVLTEDGAKLSEINLDEHPESFQLEKNGPRLFVNLPNSRKIAIIDRTNGSVVDTWRTDAAVSNFPMAPDEDDHCLFVVCRRPARLIILDTNGGRILEKLPAVGDSDDVFYDKARKRIYATGGEGGHLCVPAAGSRSLRANCYRVNS